MLWYERKGEHIKTEKKGESGRETQALGEKSASRTRTSKRGAAAGREKSRSEKGSGIG